MLFWEVSQVVLVVKNPPAGDARDVHSIPGSGLSPGKGTSNPLQYSCLESPMDRGAWWAIVHGVTKSRTRLKQLNTHACVFLSLWGHFTHSPTLSDHCQKNRTIFFFWLHCACGILVPQPRIEHTPPALVAHSPNHWPAREVSEMEEF